MEAVTYNQIKNKLNFFMDKVYEDHEPVIVARNKGKNSVLMSLDDYRSIEETCYLLSNPHTAARLIKAIEEVNAGKTIKKDIKDFNV